MEPSVPRYFCVHFRRRLYGRDGYELSDTLRGKAETGLGLGRCGRANVIAPGFINTDMTGKLSEELRAEWAKQIPLRRAGEGEDVAGAALFLASDLAAYVTGQVLQVDGGMAM